MTARVIAFDPIQIGQLPLPNRIAVAPMTRSRAAANDLATALMARYYAQRASAGLIITEGIQPGLPEDRQLSASPHPLPGQDGAAGYEAGAG